MLVLNVSANHRYLYICTCHITFTLHVSAFVSVKPLDSFDEGPVCWNIFKHDITYVSDRKSGNLQPYV